MSNSSIYLLLIFGLFVWFRLGTFGSGSRASQTNKPDAVQQVRPDPSRNGTYGWGAGSRSQWGDK